MRQVLGGQALRYLSETSASVSVGMWSSGLIGHLARIGLYLFWYMPFFHCFFAAPEGLIHIADCLLVHICHGFPIPPSVSSDLVERVASEVEYMWYATFEYPTIQDHAKVGIGFLISEIWMVRKCGWYLWREHLCCTVVRIEEASRLEQQLLMFRLGVVLPWREFISPGRVFVALGREVSFALRGSRFAPTGRHNLFYYLFYSFIINVALLDG